MELIKLFEELSCKYQSLVFELTWDKIADWYLVIRHRDSETIIFEGNVGKFDYLAAQALIAMYDWLDEREN